MKVLAVHPSGLMYSKVFLRLEPLGLERVAAPAHGRPRRPTARPAGLQESISRAATHLAARRGGLLAQLPGQYPRDRRPGALTANCCPIPGVRRRPLGHLHRARDPAHAEGAIDCVIKGEGEEIAAVAPGSRADKRDLGTVPGAVTMAGEGPPPRMLERLDDLAPARDLLQNRHKYFIGALDPCASVEFSRGCPWDCTFCSAWTFYGRTYRKVSPERSARIWRAIREPGVFIVDDVAFIHAGTATPSAKRSRRATSRRSTTWRPAATCCSEQGGLPLLAKARPQYMFLGVEAIDEAGLKRHRKRVQLGKNFEAMEYRPLARHHRRDEYHCRPELGSRRASRRSANGCLEVPEIVN